MTWKSYLGAAGVVALLLSSAATVKGGPVRTTVLYTPSLIPSGDGTTSLICAATNVSANPLVITVTLYDFANASVLATNSYTIPAGTSITAQEYPAGQPMRAAFCGISFEGRASDVRGVLSKNAVFGQTLVAVQAS